MNRKLAVPCSGLSGTYLTYITKSEIKEVLWCVSGVKFMSFLFPFVVVHTLVMVSLLVVGSS